MLSRKRRWWVAIAMRLGAVTAEEMAGAVVVAWALPLEIQLLPLTSFGSRAVGLPAEYKSLIWSEFGRSGRRIGGDSLVPSDVSNGPAPFRCREASPERISFIHAGGVCHRWSLTACVPAPTASDKPEPEMSTRKLATAPPKWSMVHETTIVCPECGRSQTETMPAATRQRLYSCKGCGAVLTPKSGDCCVYCSHSTSPCPSIQVRILRVLGELFAPEDDSCADSCPCSHRYRREARPDGERREAVAACRCAENCTSARSFGLGQRRARRIGRRTGEVRTAAVVTAPPETSKARTSRGGTVSSSVRVMLRCAVSWKVRSQGDGVSTV